MSAGILAAQQRSIPGVFEKIYRVSFTLKCTILSTVHAVKLNSVWTPRGQKLVHVGCGVFAPGNIVIEAFSESSSLSLNLEPFMHKMQNWCSKGEGKHLKKFRQKPTKPLHSALLIGIIQSV